ncbi:PadR family transcriptional regulator [Embleya sp. NPDC020886]|uniref:PadR family transcriptional regulator n=1 Tax=Embleya sp. NPDC020886 TaxID=3363980 RepID=UPI00379FADBB
MQLDFVILGILALRRYSGYDLRKWMEGPLKYIGYGVQLPQIYRRLAKLVERGWVEYDVDLRDGGPDAKLYRMTETGQQALRDWARSPYVPSPRIGDPEFVIRFIFGGQLDPEIALTVVRAELAFREANQDPSGAPPWTHNLPYAHLQMPGLDPAWVSEVHLSAHEHGYSTGSAYIAWLRLLQHRLERRAAQIAATRTDGAPGTPPREAPQSDEVQPD